MMTTDKLFQMGYNFQGGNGVCYAIPGFGARHYNNYTSTYRYDPNIWEWVEVGKEPLLDASC
jgi:hypothetical protein